MSTFVDKTITEQLQEEFEFQHLDWENLENPKFENDDLVHNWRNHISDIAKKYWFRLSIEARAILYAQAEYESDYEEWD